MKNTLRITALAAFTLIGSVSFGQSLNVSAGFTTSNLRLSDGESSGSYTETYNGGIYTSEHAQKSIGSFNASIGFEFRLGNRLSLETGLKMLSRGYGYEYKSSYESDTESFSSFDKYSYKMNFVDLPVILNTAITTGDLRVYTRTGVYASFMSSVRYKEHSSYSDSDGDSYTEDYDERSSEMDMDERLGAGINLGIGAEYKGFFFETNYTAGLLSMADWDVEITNHDFSFSLGYKLKFKK